MSSSLAVAQTSEDQRREAQRDFQDRQLRNDAQVVSLGQSAVSVDNGNYSLPVESPCFTIHALTANGHESFPALLWVDSVLQNYADRCIGREGINLILRRLNARFMDQGFVTTRAAIAGQDTQHSCYGTGAQGCTQVEIPVPGGPQGTHDGNAQLIRYQGGVQIDANGNPIKP